jgi:hypothetical protein
LTESFTSSIRKTTQFLATWANQLFPFSDILLFPEKEAKSVALLRRRIPHTPKSAKPTQGVWGLAPKKRLVLNLVWDITYTCNGIVYGSDILFFSRKRSKKRCSASQKNPPKSAKPTQGVWGLAPKKRLVLNLVWDTTYTCNGIVYGTII